jgi:hypothetical protein
MSGCDEQVMNAGAALAPRRVRAAVYVALVLIALASIWLIDRRAMQRMHELSAHPSPLGERPGEGSGPQAH